MQRRHRTESISFTARPSPLSRLTCSDDGRSTSTAATFSTSPPCRSASSTANRSSSTTSTTSSSTSSRTRIRSSSRFTPAGSGGMRHVSPSLAMTSRACTASAGPMSTASSALNVSAGPAPSPFASSASRRTGGAHGASLSSHRRSARRRCSTRSRCQRPFEFRSPRRQGSKPAAAQRSMGRCGRDGCE